MNEWKATMEERQQPRLPDTQPNPIELFHARVLDAGLQFQVLTTPTALRKELFEIAQRVSRLIASKEVASEETEGELRLLQKELEQICAKVPMYNTYGVEALPQKPYLSMVAKLISERMKRVKSLQALSRKYEDQFRSATSELGALYAQERTRDASWQKKKEAAERKYHSSKGLYMEIETKIEASMWFGPDVLD